MKKIIFSSLSVLCFIAVFFACQKETSVKESETASVSTESVSLREGEGEGEADFCSKAVRIQNAQGMNLCGNNLPQSGVKSCKVCGGAAYAKFLIDLNDVTITMLTKNFALSNPTSTPVTVTFSIAGCEESSITIPANSTVQLVIYKPLNLNCCKVKLVGDVQGPGDGCN